MHHVAWHAVTCWCVVSFAGARTSGRVIRLISATAVWSNAERAEDTENNPGCYPTY